MNAVKLVDNSFNKGTLERISYVRPGRLFTANISLMKTNVGLVKEIVLREIVERIVAILRKDL